MFEKILRRWLPPPPSDELPSLGDPVHLRHENARANLQAARQADRLRLTIKRRILADDFAELARILGGNHR